MQPQIMMRKSKFQMLLIISISNWIQLFVPVSLVLVPLPLKRRLCKLMIILKIVLAPVHISNFKACIFKFVF